MGFSQNAKKYRNIYLSVVGVVSLGIITSGITLSALPPRNLALRSSFYEAKISGDETIYMNLGDSASYQYTARAFNRDITRDSKTVWAIDFITLLSSPSDSHTYDDTYVRNGDVSIDSKTGLLSIQNLKNQYNVRLEVTNTDSVVGVLDIVIRNFATSISILSEDVILLNESDSFFVELQLSNVLFDQKWEVIGISDPNYCTLVAQIDDNGVLSMLTTEIRENYVFETYASITVTVSGNNGNDLILTDTRILDVIIGNKDVEISPKGFYFTNSINTIQTIPTALSHELISARWSLSSLPLYDNNLTDARASDTKIPTSKNGWMNIDPYNGFLSVIFEQSIVNELDAWLDGATETVYNQNWLDFDRRKGESLILGYRTGYVYADVVGYNSTGLTVRYHNIPIPFTIHRHWRKFTRGVVMNPSLTVYATDGLDSINDPSPVLSPDLYEYGLDIDVNSWAVSEKFTLVNNPWWLSINQKTGLLGWGTSIPTSERSGYFDLVFSGRNQIGYDFGGNLVITLKWEAYAGGFSFLGGWRGWQGGVPYATFSKGKYGGTTFINSKDWPSNAASAVNGWYWDQIVAHEDNNVSDPLWKGHKSIGEIVYESVRQDIPSHANKSVTAEIVKVGGQIYDSWKPVYDVIGSRNNGVLLRVGRDSGSRYEHSYNDPWLSVWVRYTSHYTGRTVTRVYGYVAPVNWCVDCVSEDGYFSISSRMRKYSPNSSGFNTYVTGKSTVITSLVGF